MRGGTNTVQKFKRIRRTAATAKQSGEQSCKQGRIHNGQGGGIWIRWIDSLWICKWTNYKAVDYFPLIVSICGGIVLFGWLADIKRLVEIIPGTPTMRPASAISFIVCGMMLYMSKKSIGHIFAASFAIIGIVAMTRFVEVSIFGDGFLRLVNSIIIDNKNTVYSVAPGIPSVAGMICFVVICAGVLYRMLSFRPGNLFFILPVVIGIICIIGYSLWWIWPGNPLIFYHAVWSTGMAPHTAVLFILLGLGGVVDEVQTVD